MIQQPFPPLPPAGLPPPILVPPLGLATVFGGSMRRPRPSPSASRSSRRRRLRRVAADRRRFRVRSAVRGFVLGFVCLGLRRHRSDLRNVSIGRHNASPCNTLSEFRPNENLSYRLKDRNLTSSIARTEPAHRSNPESSGPALEEFPAARKGRRLKTRLGIGDDIDQVEDDVGPENRARRAAASPSGVGPSRRRERRGRGPLEHDRRTTVVERGSSFGDVSAERVRRLAKPAVATGSEPAAACCLASAIRRSTIPAARSSQGRRAARWSGQGAGVFVFSVIRCNIKCDSRDADPPYIGQAKKHYSADPRCTRSIMSLTRRFRLNGYDGMGDFFTLSSPSLKEILSDLSGRMCE